MGPGVAQGKAIHVGGAGRSTCCSTVLSALGIPRPARAPRPRPGTGAPSGQGVRAGRRTGARIRRDRRVCDRLLAAGRPAARVRASCCSLRAVRPRARPGRDARHVAPTRSRLRRATFRGARRCRPSRASTGRLRARRRGSAWPEALCAVASRATPTPRWTSPRSSTTRAAKVRASAKAAEVEAFDLRAERPSCRRWSARYVRDIDKSTTSCPPLTRACAVGAHLPWSASVSPPRRWPRRSCTIPIRPGGARRRWRSPSGATRGEPRTSRRGGERLIVDSEASKGDHVRATEILAALGKIRDRAAVPGARRGHSTMCDCALSSPIRSVLSGMRRPGSGFRRPSPPKPRSLWLHTRLARSLRSARRDLDGTTLPLPLPLPLPASAPGAPAPAPGRRALLPPALASASIGLRHRPCCVAPHRAGAGAGPCNVSVDGVPLDPVARPHRLPAPRLRPPDAVPGESHRSIPLVLDDSGRRFSRRCCSLAADDAGAQ